MKGRVTDMKHHVAIVILLTLSAVLGGHIQDTASLGGNSQQVGERESSSLFSSREYQTFSSSFISQSDSDDGERGHESREITTSSGGNEDSSASQELEHYPGQDLDLSSSLEFDPSPTREPVEATVVSLNHQVPTGNVSPAHKSIIRGSAISSSTTEKESPWPPFSPSPIDHFASSSHTGSIGLQVNNAITTSSTTSIPYLNSTSIVDGSASNTHIENTATITQEEFNSILTRFSLDALQATQIAERLGIAGSGVTELERELAYANYDIHGPGGRADRPYALPLGRNTRTTPHRRRNAGLSRATRRLFLGDPSLCYSGSCEFFLMCWLGGGLIDGGCGGFLFACCSRPNVRGGRGQETYRDDSTGLIPVNYGPIRNDNSCGLSSSDRLTAQRRIVGGTEAGFGSFPWQAYIRIGSSRCGGSLINQYHVVTAGHCVARARPTQIRVTLGDYVLNSNQEPLQPKIYGASEIKVHPNFKFTPQADRFDVAVITLDSPVRYEPHIQPICLPEKGADWLGSYAWAAGWGALQSGSRVRPKTLQVVDVPILDSRLCEDWHRQKGINVIIYDEMMCAGYGKGGKDSCQGDSGGPLMIQDSGRWYLAGIVSAGYSCAQGKQPGIYHKVSYTSDWISYAANS